MFAKHARRIVLTASLLTIAISPAFGGSSRRKFTLGPSPVGARDLHFVVAGTINDVDHVTISSAPDQAEANGNSYGCAWNAALPTGTNLTVDAKRSTTTGGWNFKSWWTFTGSLANPGGNPSNVFASLYIPDTTGGLITVMGENDADGAVLASSITATVVSDQSLFNTANWFNATGTNYTFPSGVLLPHSQDVPFGAISLAPNQWLKITADFNGDTHVMGYTVSTPEPASIGLVLLAALGMGIRRR